MADEGPSPQGGWGVTGYWYFQSSMEGIIGVVKPLDQGGSEIP